MKNTLFAFIFVLAALLAGACDQTDEQGSAPASIPDQQRVDSAKDSPQIHKNPREDFLEQLRNGKELYSFFSNHWTLVYRGDDRCDGASVGEVAGLARAEVDKTIRMKIKADGEGWLENCDEKGPREFDLDFNLKERVADWDSIEISDSGNQTEGVSILGNGEAYYLVLYYGNDDLIVKMEYHSEDPG
jgi:hypothetical protein